MKNKMKKLVLCLIAIISVIPFINAGAYDYEYEYVNESNKTPVELKREEIYRLNEMYDYLLNKDSSMVLLNYSGVCSMVTVDGFGTYPLDEYVAGVLKAEVGVYSKYPEYLKAQAIAIRSFVIASKIDSDSCNVGSGQFFQVFTEVSRDNPSDQKYYEAAEATTGMVVIRNGEVALTQYMSYPNANYSYDYNGKWVVKLQKFSDDPSTAWTWTGTKSKDAIQSALGYYAGAVGMTSNHHYGMSQTVGAWLGHEGKSYDEIIETFYGTDNSGLSILSDGNYTANIEFVDSEFGEIWYYNQGDYREYYYSSDVTKPEYKDSDGNWATIASHGCGPTSLSIVLSSFSNSEINPMKVTQQVCNSEGCYSSGSSYGALATVAQSYGYKTQFVERSGDISKVTNALASGDSLVIALMGPGKFTSGGHYIVLTGTRSDGYVSVADPASREKTNTKWFSMNLIVEEAKDSGFLIITK